ncbi:MAG: YqgE/AlgH family protein [Verrucomicrobiales bacterium]
METRIQKGYLLVAQPQLADSPFEKTVIYLADHDDEEGTFGFVLNKPLTENLADLAEEALEALPSSVPLLWGGPVATNQVGIMVQRWANGRLTFAGHQTLEEAIEDSRRPGRALKCYLGHSGWSQGQLLGELGQGSWVLMKPTGAVLGAPELMWRTLMHSLGGWWRLQANEPEDLGMN